MSNSSVTLAPRIRGSGQVVQTAFSNTTAVSTVSGATNTTAVDTGIAVSITPLYASSTIAGKITCSISSPGNAVHIIVKRDSTTLDVNNSSATTVAAYTSSNRVQSTFSFPFVDDAHNSTSSITYKIFAYVNTTTSSDVHVNRAGTDTDAGTVGRFATSIFVKERI